MRTDMLEAALDAYREDAEGPLAERLRFLEGLTRIQAEIKAVDRSYESPAAGTVREALATGQPLFLSAPPALPRDQVLAAVERIAAYVADEAGLDAEQSAALREADFSAAITDERIGRLTQSVDLFVTQVTSAVGAAEDACLKPPTVAYVLVSALTPFFASSARVLGGQSDVVDKKSWMQGTCPVCGSPATLGVVSEHTELKGGERTLWCGLCHTEWAYERLRCARCGNRSSDSLRYVHVEGDPAHRLHLCDECHGYLRVVFESDLHKPLSGVIEDAVTVALDAIALDQGYSATGVRMATGDRAD